MLRMMLNTHAPIHIKRITHPEFDFSMIRLIFRQGIPNGLENSMFQIGKLLLHGFTFALPADDLVELIPMALHTRHQVLQKGLVAAGEGVRLLRLLQNFIHGLAAAQRGSVEHLHRDLARQGTRIHIRPHFF